MEIIFYQIIQQYVTVENFFAEMVERPKPKGEAEDKPSLCDHWIEKAKLHQFLESKSIRVPAEVQEKLFALLDPKATGQIRILPLRHLFLKMVHRESQDVTRILCYQFHKRGISYQSVFDYEEAAFMRISSQSSKTLKKSNPPRASRSRAGRDNGVSVCKECANKVRAEC